MNRYLNVFIAAVFSCGFAFSQTTNLVDVNLTGSGDYPTNYAASFNALDGVFVTNSTFTGGAGNVGRGGSGLFTEDIALTRLTGGTFQGGSGGNGGDILSGSSDPTLYADGGIGFDLNGLSFEFGDPGAEEIYIQDASFTGGDGGFVELETGERGNVSGGAGALISDVVIYIENTAFTGGDGGSISSAGAAGSVADGGDGLLTGFDGFVQSLDDGVTGTGGDGGTISVSSGSGLISATGGSGMNTLGYYDGSGFELAVLGGTSQGGAGGTVNNQGTDTIAGADVSGGTGFNMYADVAVVSNGTFTGGDGGQVTGLNQGSVVDGGDGMYIEEAGSVEIYGGIFEGGQAGTVNGVQTGSRGAALRVSGSYSPVAIYDGTFIGLGLRMEAEFFDTAVDIYGGTFGDVVMDAGSGFANTLNITGGTIEDLTFSNSGINNISLSSGAVTSGKVVQNGGTVNVSQWEDEHFMDTTISDGTMNFNNQMFNLDGTFELQAATAAANFNGGLTVQNGGTLNIGLSPVTASSVLTADGTRINTSYNGTTLGRIDSTGALTVGSNTTWTINAGASAVAADQTFDIATATGAIINNITEQDVVFNGSGGEAGWLGGITDLQVTGTVLRATYGQSTIDDVLGIADNPVTDFGQAMTDLSRLLPPGSPGYNRIAKLANSQAVGTLLLANSYVRTTEMANTLVGLQSIFSDQIKDRTRSQLRYQEVGYPEASTPAGSAGWEAMRRFSDRVEESFGYDEVADAIDAVTPDIDVDLMGGIDAAVPDVKIGNMTLPVSYQTWGRGYGSHIDRDESDDFPGYEADIGGGMLGLDKTINNVLLGIAGGYARTDVDGDAGKDGTSDTGHVAAYFSAHGDHLFLDANANYAYNDVDTDYDILGYEGDYAAHTVGLYAGGGFAISIAKRVLLTPEVSILSTYYKRESYTEESFLYPDMKWDSYDEWSHLGTVGATLTMIQKINLSDAEMALQPEVRVHLLHEFNDEFDNEEYSMTGGLYTVGVALREGEENLVKVGAGVRLSQWSSDTTAIGFDVDGTFGDDYNAYIVSGQITHRF